MKHSIKIKQGFSTSQSQQTATVQDVNSVHELQEISNNLTACEGGSAKNATVSTQLPSKRAKRKEFCKEFRYDPLDTTVFADKEIAESFDKAYKDGNIHDEVHYYYVPLYVVRSEYKLLRQHQQTNMMDLLFSVHAELELRAKLIASIDKDKDLEGLKLSQSGESILQPLKLLLATYAHLNNYKLIHKTMLPKQNKRQ